MSFKINTIIGQQKLKYHLNYLSIIVELYVPHFGNCQAR